MKTLLAAAAGLALLAGASAASAENYASIGYNKFSAKDASDVDLGGVTARVGVNVNPWFGVEGEASIGVDDASFTDSSGTYSVELKHEIGVFAVARAPIGEGFTVFARGGYASSKYEATIPGLTGSGSSDGVAYGVGGQYDFGANGARLDFTRYDTDFGDIDSWSISYVRKF
jgi:hypothetical protein